MGQPSEGHRRTKIIATIGPATRSLAAMRSLIDAGTDAFRLNFSHGSAHEHAENIRIARRASSAAGREIAILGDLPGPKLRLSEIERGSVELRQGREIVLTTDQVPGDSERIAVAFSGLPAAVAPGAPVYLADGRVRLRVESVTPRDIRSRIEVGGIVASRQGLNLPASTFDFPAAGEQDLAWVDFACAHGVDALAVSYVRRPQDLAPVEQRLRANESDIPLIAKIEKPEATVNAASIVEAVSGGIMVARGDLGIEIPIEQVPTAQRRLLALAGRHSRPSITATQMLASMVSSPRPTRAEVSDVANAIYQGTDAVMLSEETAIGEHPFEAVRVMDRTARATEPDLPYGEWVAARSASNEGDVAQSVARAAVASTYALGLKALVVPTFSGRTARLVSAHRPRVPVLAVSPRVETVRRLNLLFGVRCARAAQWASLGALLDHCARLAAETGLADSGDLIGITAGLPDQELGTNLFEVHRVP